MKKRKGANRSRARLEQAEWDFRQCPKDRLRYCWDYEFAREVPWIVDFYQKMSAPWPNVCRDDGEEGPEIFDKHDNLHVRQPAFDPVGNEVGFLNIQLPRGFPEKPYLRTNHVATPRSSSGNRMTVDTYVSAEWWEDHLERSKVTLRIDWSAVNTRLVEDFEKWIENNRPYKADEKRGRSDNKKWIADLKALGAYRLLRCMSAPEAQRYSDAIKVPMFAKESDWYEAKGRAIKILCNDFGTDDRDLWPKDLLFQHRSRSTVQRQAR